jgi:hypothetical protein
MIERVFEICRAKDKKREVEEYLFEFSYNLMHALSLLWSKNEKTYTPEFCNFLARKCLGAMVRAFLLVDHNEEKIERALIYYIKEALKVIKEFNTDYVIINMAVEFTGGMEQTDIVLKMAVLLAVLESKFGTKLKDLLTGYEDY